MVITSEKPRVNATTAVTTTNPPITTAPGIHCPPTEGSEMTTTTDSPSGRDDSLPETTSSSEDTTTESQSPSDLTTLRPLVTEVDDQYLTTTTTELPLTTTVTEESTTITTIRVETGKATTKFKRRKQTTTPTLDPDYFYTIQETSPSEIDGVTEAFYDMTSPEQREYETFPSTTAVPLTRRATTSARLLPVTRTSAMTTPEAGMCSNDVCRNGGTCVMTPDGWQVT